VKQCAACGVTLPYSAYRADRRTKDGYAAKCDDCRGSAAVDATHKTCVLCVNPKAMSEYGRNLRRSDGRQTVCLECAATPARQWAKRGWTASDKQAWTTAHKALLNSRNRDTYLRKTYTISDQQFWMLFDVQNGKCCLCSRPARTKNLSVDHDHKCCKGSVSCGRCVRGLLCGRCNTKLMPLVDHHLDVIHAAIEYANNPPAQQLLNPF
jgi:hypothetical protein